MLHNPWSHKQYTHSHSSFILCESSSRVLGFTLVGDLATCHSFSLFTKSRDTHELLVFGIRSADLDASDQKLPMTLKLQYHSLKLLSFMLLVISASSRASSKLSRSLSLFLSVSLSGQLCPYRTRSMCDV